MTQTAVEWLIEQINSENYQNAFGPVYISSILIEPALEMEKQQIALSKTEISDVEIEEAASEKFITDLGRFGFISGAKWYREQLKKKQ